MHSKSHGGRREESSVARGLAASRKKEESGVLWSFLFGFAYYVLYPLSSSPAYARGGGLRRPAPSTQHTLCNASSHLNPSVLSALPLEPGFVDGDLVLMATSFLPNIRPSLDTLATHLSRPSNYILSSFEILPPVPPLRTPVTAKSEAATSTRPARSHQLASNHENYRAPLLLISIDASFRLNLPGYIPPAQEPAPPALDARDDDDVPPLVALDADEDELPVPHVSRCIHSTHRSLNKSKL
ncbi:hypothetical protein B0H11DRAFT_2254455 [Mycena galericulata]|nr:hypothetical protein B0H11DRAFT_2254455 [Mycena galericulata]